MSWKNRIVGQREMATSELSPHPSNWRKHPQRQQQALHGALDEVGFVQGVIWNQTTGRLIDGHLRVEMALQEGQAMLPVTVVELSEEEERLVLATLDPIGALADLDTEVFRELRASINTDNQALATLLEEQIPDFQPTTNDQNPLDRTEGDEWYTPAHILELARKVLGSIDLDPATSKQAQATVNAAKYFTKDDDGLSQPWHGNVWLNPPYSSPLISDFTAKLLQEVDEGRVTQAICLVNNATDTHWFQNILNRQPACFVSGRISFEHASGRNADGNRQGQAIFYFGLQSELFNEVFSAVGTVVVRR